jgi:hypothetical protein
MVLADSDDNDEEFVDEMIEAICPENSAKSEREPLEGDFVLVQYIHGKREIFYIGEVMCSKDDDSVYEVNCL